MEGFTCQLPDKAMVSLPASSPLYKTFGFVSCEEDTVLCRIVFVSFLPCLRLRCVMKETVPQKDLGD